MPILSHVEHRPVYCRHCERQVPATITKWVGTGSPTGYWFTAEPLPHLRRRWWPSWCRGSGEVVTL